MMGFTALDTTRAGFGVVRNNNNIPKAIQNINPKAEHSQ